MSNRTGERVRYWRIRRGLDRATFASRVDRSPSWVKAIENGQRELTRLPLLERVAQALGVTVEALTDPAEAERATRAPDAAEIAAITGALEHYEVILGAPVNALEHPQSANLAKRVNFLDEAFLASRFSSIGRDLPKLLIEAQRAAKEQPGAESIRVLVKVYRIASSTLLKLGADQTAWLAADRAMVAAQTTDDLYTLARATRSVSRAMTNLGRTEAALDALLAMATQMQPEVATSTLEVAAMYGMVLLAAEIAAAKYGDAHTASAMHNEASKVAQWRFASDASDKETAFGPTNVDLHWVSSLVRLGRPDEAVQYAEGIDRAAVALLPRERRGTFGIDLALAHHQLGRYAEAETVLLAAERIAPEEARCRPGSKTLIANLINAPSRNPSTEMRALARRAGVQA
ncbi:helix-turn-helix domain-containing protein [Catenulispora pinisilvae]|uniref:helix-turn-helix domain-containing protein n=1 Tax=Catenulispora pinisilvae TaxID=2705253 RepID=UPI0018924BBB|nr:helix-turn-helix transcriptional regulator [Catenulispora pinisilvae]